MAYAYLVTGSEDGPLAIYASKKRALDAAIRYVEQSGKTAKVPEDTTGWYFTVDHDGEYGQLHAEVEKFYLD